MNSMDPHFTKLQSVVKGSVCLWLLLLSLTTHAQLQTVIQRGHDLAVLSVAYSPDSNYVATGSRDRTAKLWQVSTGREVRSFFGHEGSVNCIDFNSDGTWMITSSGDRTARIWEVATGKQLFVTEPAHKLLTAVAFSPDDKYFIVGGYDDEASVYDSKTRKIVTRIKVNADQGLGYGINVAFSPDSKWLAVGEDNRTAKVYSVGSWELANTFKQEEGWCGGCATWVTFSETGQSLFMVSNKGPLRSFDLASATLVKQYAESIEDVVGLSMSASTNQLTVFTKTEILRWNLKSATTLEPVAIGKEIEVNEGRASGDGKTALLATDQNIVISWDLITNRSLQKFEGILNQVDKGGVTYDPNSYWESHIAKYLRLKNSILLSPDDKTLLTGKYGTRVKQWDIASGQTVMEFVGHEKAALCYSYSSDGKRLLTGGADGNAILWDVAKGDTLKVIRAHREPIFAVQFSNDESRILTSSWDATLKIFDLASGKRLEYFDFDNTSAYDAIFSGNDLYIFTAQFDFSLKMWENDTKKVVRDFIGHSDVIASIALSPDEAQLLSASWDGSIRLWNVATGLMNRKLIGHTGPVYAARWSKDGSKILSGGADRTVRIWDAQTGKLLQTLEGHQAEVTSLAVNSDGTMLISHSTDGATKFWDLKSNKEFFEHIHIGSTDWMAKTPEGYFHGTDGARKVIHFVDGMKTYSVDQFFNDYYRPDLLPQLFRSRGSSTKESLQGRLDKSPPPQVKVAVVETSDPKLVEVYTRVTDAGGGVKSLRLFHNGKNVPIGREFTLPRAKGESTVYRHEARVLGGNNVFSAIASNNDNLESDPSSGEYYSEQEGSKGTCYLFAIGINEYKNPKLTLNYARPDAESFASTLTASGGSLFKEIKLVTLYDEKASAQDILGKLDELAGIVQPEDVFILYYAGHGSMVDNRFFFIPSESIRLYDTKSLAKEAIEATVLQEKLKAIKALKQLIIMDACQSGGSVELLAARGASEEKAIAQLSRSAGIHVLASAGSEQFAAEFKELGHGLFTYVLLKALEGEADGAPKDGKVTIYELKSYLDDQVPDITKKMKGKPQYPYTFSRGHDFPITIDGDN